MRRWQERFAPVGCDSKQFHAEYASLLSRVGWSYLITLTLDPKRFPRSGPESWLKMWRWFLFTWMATCAMKAGQAWKDGHRIKGPWANAYRHGRGQPMWILATEPHRDDRLHAHGLVMLTRDLPWLEYAEGHKIWRAERGLAWIEAPKSQARVAGYVSKYVVKGGPDALTFSPNFDAAMMPDALSSAEKPLEASRGERR